MNTQKITYDLLQEKDGTRDVVIDMNNDVSFLFWYSEFVYAPDKAGRMTEFSVGDNIIKTDDGKVYGEHQRKRG